MCQQCVKDGYLTQAELEQGLAAGDRTLIPIYELPAAEFMSALTDMVAAAIQSGTDPKAALQKALDLTDAYREIRRQAGNPLTEEEALALLNDPRMSAPWN
jgi:hypothetical protein